MDLTKREVQALQGLMWRDHYAAALVYLLALRPAMNDELESDCPPMSVLKDMLIRQPDLGSHNSDYTPTDSGVRHILKQLELEGLAQRLPTPRSKPARFKLKKAFCSD